jgi:D-serine dehydratase
MKGLNPYMTMQLHLTRHHKFQELVDKAIILEDDYKSVQEEQRKKARTEPNVFQIENQHPT